MLPLPRPFADSRDTLIVDATMAAQMAAAARATGMNNPLPPSNPPSGPAPAPAGSAPEPKRRRRKAPWVIIGLILAVLLAGFAGWYLAAGPGKTVPTPDLVGSTVPEATSALAASGLKLESAEGQFSETAPAGTIISTDPPAGDSIKAEGTVTVVVSKGPERYDVPALKGMTQQEAAAALTQANLTVGAVSQEFDDKVPTDLVRSSSPKAGQAVKPGTAVDLVISKGPKPVPVPNVEGKKLTSAKNQLGDAGLKVDSAQEYSESVAKNVVISQKPKAGTVVDSGSRVSLVVSKGPPPVTVPNLIDAPKGKALAMLKKVGLNAKVVQGAATPLKRVYSQDPAAGTSVPKGSTVTIRII
jgi:serine/threonine-protein kinase